MDKPLDFSTLLNQFMTRGQFTPGRLEAITIEMFGAPNKVSKQTIVYWVGVSEKRRKPRDWSAIVKVARALRLSKKEVNQLLQSAGHPQISELANKENPAYLQSILLDWDGYLDIKADDGSTSTDSNIEQILQELPESGNQAVQELKKSGFIGRKIEIEEYAEKLSNHHWVVINGFPGVGKTLLATKLANQFAIPENIFWIKLNSRDDFDHLLYMFYVFLAQHGIKDCLEYFLNRQFQKDPYQSLKEKSIQVVQRLRWGKYVICFDNFHFVENDQEIKIFMEELLQAVNSSSLKLIIISRNLPEFVSSWESKPLLGLNEGDTRSFLQSREINLLDDQVISLHSYTAGNPKLLIYVIEALKHSIEPSNLLSNLDKNVKDINRYLIREVDRGLSESEQKVMKAVAVLGEDPGSVEAIEAILEEDAVLRDLIRLTERNLISENENPSGTLYELHATMREFYYRDLGKDRNAMHYRAGLFYEKHETDALKAATHYEKAGEHVRAAQLAIGDSWKIINRGKVRRLKLFLENLDKNQVNLELQVRINIVLGEIYNFLGKDQVAKEHFYRSLSLLDRISTIDPAKILKARIYLGFASALEYQTPKEALEWIRRGLDEVPKVASYERAALSLKAGSLYIAMEDCDEAQKILKNGLMFIPFREGYLMAGMYMNLTTIHGMQGEFEEALTNCQKASKIFADLGDSFRLVDVWTNIGMIKDLTEDWAGAVEEYKHALQTAENLGSITQQARLKSNLGLIYTNQGQDELAEICLKGSIQQSHDILNIELEINGLINLAQLEIRRGNYLLVEQNLIRAENLAKAKEAWDKITEIFRNRAEALFGMGKPYEAQDEVQKALQLAEERDNCLEKGISLRVLGEILQSMGMLQAALNSYEESVKNLNEMDRFEATRTHMVWGKAIYQYINHDLGFKKLKECLLVFREFGANREIEIIEKIIGRQE